MAATTSVSIPLARKTPLFSHLLKFSCNPISASRFPAQTWYFRSCSSCGSHVNSRIKDFGQVGFLRFRVSAVSDGVAGGYGGSGDGNSGGDGGGGGEGQEQGDQNNWLLLSWYLGLLGKYPVTTKAITSALLNLIGDLVCQIAIDQVPSLDLKRTFLFTLVGLVLVGPTLHFWYLHLSKLVTVPGALGAFLCLLLDQFLFSPIFIGVFFSTLVTLEGRPSQVVLKLQQEWFSAVLANWQLWIPFQFLNFRFVPQQFQVLAANFIALIWNVILSFKAHKEILSKKACVSDYLFKDLMVGGQIHLRIYWDARSHNFVCIQKSKLWGTDFSSLEQSSSS